MPALRRPLVPALLAALLLAATAGRAAAQPFLYALNENGRLSVNGTLLDKLSSAFDASSSGDTNAEQRWWELFVHGADRYALRLDGNLNSNGSNLYKLPFESLEQAAWVGLAVTDEHVWALRTDGLLSRDDTSAIDYAEGDFFFVELATDGVSTFALRSDGAIFQDLVAEPGWKLAGGPGIDGAAEGEAEDTIWIDMDIDPIGGVPHALRRDGRLVRADLAEGEIPDGTLLATLPFPGELTSATAYTDVTFSDDGLWYALRADGKVFDQDHQVDELLDLPGTRLDDLETTGMEAVGRGSGLFITRWDGRLFDLSGGDAIVNLDGSRYRNIALSEVAPDLTDFKNSKSKLTRYQVAAVTGEPVTVPVLATDTDRDATDLVVTVDPDDLPPGMVWDDVARTLTWDAPGPKGGYKIPVLVDDGVASKPTRGKIAVKVRDPDTDVEKNKKPHASKVKGARALVGRELRLPILVSDLDGDALTLEAKTDGEPYTLGAVFDTDTATVIWTPSLADIGKYSLPFTVDDGTKVRKFKVKLQVVASLLAL